MPFKKSAFFLLIIIFFYGLFLRLFRLDEGLIFGYDQARDAYRATEIVAKGKLKLLGPETDIPGVHHGVGYYYLLAIPYGLFQDPVVAASFLALLSALGIFLSYFTAYEFFKDKRIAIITSILFAASFEMVQYARWLSNPSLGVITVIFAFLFLWRWIKGDQKSFILALLSIAASLHFQFFLAYLFFVPPVVYFLYKAKLSLRNLLTGVIAALIIDSPIIISELKFNFQALRAFWAFFSGKSGTYSSFADFLKRYLDRLNSVIFNTLAPIDKNLVYLLVILGFILLVVYKNKIRQKSALSLLLLWLFSSFPIFIFASGAINSEFSFVGTAVSLILLTAYLINEFWQKKPSLAKIILIIIVITNIRYNLVHAEDGAYIFSVQRVMTYGLEKKLIDYTYQEARRDPFSICTLTNPLFVNTTWAYLYEYYGQRKYGYLPYFAGSNQSGYLGFLPPDTVKPKLRYLIHEPLIGIPKPAQEIFRDLEELISDKIEEKNFGTFKVEKRYLLTDKEMIVKKATFDPSLTKQLENDSYLPYRCFH